MVLRKKRSSTRSEVINLKDGRSRSNFPNLNGREDTISFTIASEQRVVPSQERRGAGGGGEDRREVPRGCKEEFQGKAPFTRGVAVAPTPQCVVEECDEMMNKYFLLCVKIVK